MHLRFLTSVSTADRGYFHSGRLIEIDPTAPDFPVFQGWVRSGLCEIVRELEPERAVSQPALERAIARRTPRPRGRGRKATAEDLDDANGAAPLLCPGGTVVCLATGPSLTEADVAYCRGKAFVVAVNDAHRLAPWAEALYSSDQRWWHHYAGVPAFAGRKFGIAPLQPDPSWGVTVLQNTGTDGVELEPTGLRTGKNSGAAAINLAVHLGARRVVLLGYDMGVQDGRAHFFGEHPRQLRANTPFDTFLEKFRTMVDPLQRLGVEVVNCSRTTRLDAFPCGSLEDVLPARAVA